MKVIIAVPTRGWIHYKVAALLGNLQAMGFALFYSQSSYGVEAARGRLINFALKFPETDAVLFLDDDVLPPTDIVARLLKHDKDVCSASYPVLKDDKVFDHSANLTEKGYRSSSFYNEGLHQVDAVGMGACLIKRTVLEKCMKERCFGLTLDDEYEVVKGEDYTFCEIAKKNGFKIFVDFDIRCAHMKMIPIGGGGDKK